MSIHSIKVPKIYKVSVELAKEVSYGVGSVKSLIYEKKKKHPNIKAIYAIVTTLFQKLNDLETLFKRSKLLEKEPKLDPWLAKVLIVELLWGKKRLPGQSKPENTIRAYEQIFKSHLSDLNTNDETPKAICRKPRYVRINTLLATLDEAVQSFRNDDGWVLNKFLDKNDYQGYLEKISSLSGDEFMIDIHVPNLLVFPSRTQFYDHPAYQNGSIILQDKASCLPVHILGAPPGSVVLDMCAAPGMKTTHLAAVLEDKGTIYATERDPKRYDTLCKIVENSGAKCIKAYNKDVLRCTKETFPGVEYILVDPSCSGTGMVDVPQEHQAVESRLHSLTGFQIKILRHALTKFPDAKRVVYSTCSLLTEENEDVVRQVLETNYNFTLVPASRFVGETWLNFGASEFGDIGRYCLYARPQDDHTNGFFVAVFERLKEGEENPFFNTRIFNFKKHVQENEKWKKKQLKRLQDEGYNQNYNERNFDNSKKYKNDTNRGRANEAGLDYEENLNHKQEYNENISNTFKNEKKENNLNQSDDVTIEHNENISNSKKIKKEKEKHTFNDANETAQNYIIPADNIINDTKKTKKKKKKDASKVKNEDISNTDNTINENIETENKEVNEENVIDSIVNRKTEKPLKNKIKYKSVDDQLEYDAPKVKKEKKRKHKEEIVNLVEDDDQENKIKKEKKKRKKDNDEDHLEAVEINDLAETVVHKKHKKNKKEKRIKNESADGGDIINIQDLDEDLKKKKKKKKNKVFED